MQIHNIRPGGIAEVAVKDLEARLTDCQRPSRGPEDGFLWIDIPACGDDETRVLTEVLRAHPMAVRDCLQRNLVPKIHAYPEYIFWIVHTIEPGDAGHIHSLELDVISSTSYLVTVHGPLGVGVPMEVALQETNTVLERIHSGRFKPRSPSELSHAVTSAMARKMEAFVATRATRIAALERQIMSDVRGSEKLVEETFRVRHELLTVGTMAAGSTEIFTRMSAMARHFPETDRPYVEDTLDQFQRIKGLCEREREFLQGIVDFYQSQVATSMNTVMERLALLVAIVTPINALAAIYGMNVIVNDETNEIQLIVTLAFMALLTTAMLFWTKRQGWW